ncbi:MAG: sugar phosphate isomerase/epimerase family protein [bacterium]
MAGRKVKIDFGINGAFLTRRWEEPENFMKLTRELGYKYHEFCADVLDPFFSGDREYQLGVARRVKEAAEKYGVTITDIYTGVATHRFHGLSHSHPSPRKRMQEWIIGAMHIAREMGVYRIGGHWDAIPVEVLGDEARYRAALTNIYSQFRSLALLGRGEGMKAIYNEQMYIPSEVPWTISQAEEFLIEVNKGSSGVPVYLTVDTGHQAGMWYGGEGDDLDYSAWVERFAPACEIIHIQQTTPDASHHWPFTKEYNEKGCVRIERVLEAMERGHRRFHERPYSKYLKPVDQTILVAEIIPGSTKTEEKLLDELWESAEYLRKFIPEGGIELSVEGDAE